MKNIEKKNKKNPKDIADEVTAKMRAHFDKLKFEPDQIADIHNNIRLSLIHISEPTRPY